MIMNLTNITNFSLDFIQKLELTEQELINQYCEYSFSLLNEKILVLAIIIFIFEIVGFFIYINKTNKKYPRINKFFESLDNTLSMISRIFILILSYFVTIKILPEYEFVYKIITIIFLIFLAFVLFREKDKIKKFISTL